MCFCSYIDSREYVVDYDDRLYIPVVWITLHPLVYYPTLKTSGGDISYGQSSFKCVIWTIAVGRIFLV